MGDNINNALKKPIVKIHIGQYFASKEPAIVYTVLGSCISVCLFDPVAKIGGMNHILHTGEEGVASDNSARFGINAMELLINEMVNLGAMRSRLVAKVFGGGNILGLNKELQQGMRNTAFVMDFLKVDKIRVIAQSTGGRFSRNLFFHTDTCEALLKKTNAKMPAELVQEEAMSPFTRVKSISQKDGDVTLF